MAVPARVRIRRIPARESKGTCWARHVAQSLWQGEERTLQIDSHTRFEAGWDVTLEEMLRMCPSDRAVLSTYPPGYTPPRELERGLITLMAPDRFDELGTLLLKAVLLSEEDAPAEPVAGAFCGACFLYGSSRLISDVPYDPHLYHLGEEVTLAVRLFTHGWDVFHPPRSVVYHRWDPGSRPRHWDESPEARALDLRSRRRSGHLLGVARTDDPEDLLELDRYGLGEARTLAEFEDFAGIRFAERSIDWPGLPP